MLFSERVAPVCHTLSANSEHHCMCNQFLVKSIYISIKFHNPLCTTYTQIQFLCIQVSKDIPNVPTVRKETIFLNLANLRTELNESTKFLQYIAQSSAVLNSCYTCLFQKVGQLKVQCIVIKVKLDVVETELNDPSICLMSIII